VVVAIGDIALSGQRLQRVSESGIAADRLPGICGDLFTVIAELAGAADPASAENDA
jgi:hypothetical protein